MSGPLDRLARLRRSWRGWRKRHPRALPLAGGSLAVLVLAAVASGLLYFRSLTSTLPGRDAIGRLGEMDQATTVYDASNRLVFTIYREQRIDVPLSRISPDLVRALVAIEDQRFYTHHGFDAFRILAAALADARRGRAAQGGSTITQQLARQSFLKPDKTLRRKLQELILARRIEQLYTKAQILELYLNKVYFGDGLYGAEAAARGFFGKTASDLTIAEAALLAGLVKSPSTYAPTISLERAVARRNVVLQAMLDSGALDRNVWQQARAERVTLASSLEPEDARGQYFKEQVRRELVERFGWQRVYQGGLRVFSTIDLAMQESAEATVRESLVALDARRRRVLRRAEPGPPLQAALIAMDPRTGQVRAMVGGRDFTESPFNRAVQARRQPGSAFKPFLYAAALEAGYTPATILDHLNDPIETLEGAWTPEDEHSSAETMSLRAGLRISSNRAAVRLLQQVGIPKTVQYAKNLGIGGVPSVPSLALGVGEVTLQSMTAAYAAFANHGLVPSPTSIRRVEDREGQVLYDDEAPEGRRAIAETTAFLMASMLADVVNAGTAARARQLGFTLPAAGKTGTTNDFNDAWFVGFTPKLVTGVWVGFDQPQTILPNGFASDIAVPLWARFMRAATRGDRPEWFPIPSGITTASICRLSGKLATSGCEHAELVAEPGAPAPEPMVYTEYFAAGTQPTTFCEIHAPRGLFGRIAGLFAGRPDRDQPPRTEDPRAPQPPPKRGFWARFFGLGKRDSK
jgi:1A family penicillin-binding protein